MDDQLDQGPFPQHLNPGKGMQSHCVFGMALVFFTMILLAGGSEHLLFFHILGIMIPTDLYFSEGLKPPASLL